MPVEHMFGPELKSQDFVLQKPRKCFGSKNYMTNVVQLIIK